MGKYQISTQTRLSLIEAAGELFAEKGVEGTTTREIARKAGTAQNAIAYHFGGIGGLVEAVWRYIHEQWNPGRLSEYLAAHREMPSDRAGRVRLLKDAIDIIFHIIYRPDHPLWINKFLVRSAMDESGRQAVASTISGSVVTELIALYTAFAGREDRDAALCWSVRLLAAPMVITARLTAFARFLDGSTVNDALYDTLKQMSLRESLELFGLAELRERMC